LIPWLEVTVGLPVWKHPAPCRPTAPSNKHDSGPPRSGFRQARRERAAELFAQGRTQVEVARQLDVFRQGAVRWQADGMAALRTRGPTSRRPKVADDQLEGIERALLAGALAHGFATDVWTLERIAVVIQGLTGVRLSNPSTWRLLRERLGWTVQRPQRQAKERHEQAIQHWVQHEWPRIKKGPARDRPGLSSTNQASR
jgi:transposase